MKSTILTIYTSIFNLQSPYNSSWPVTKFGLVYLPLVVCVTNTLNQLRIMSRTQNLNCRERKLQNHRLFLAYPTLIGDVACKINQKIMAHILFYTIGQTCSTRFQSDLSTPYSFPFLCNSLSQSEFIDCCLIVHAQFWK